MTLDEAIKHCLEVAEQNETQAEKWREEGGEEWGKTTACRECAAEHRQLAEWLIELKELREQIFNLKLDNERLRDCVDSCVRNGELDYAELAEAKRLLKLAVEDINSYVDCYESHCDECCCSQDNHCHWKHEAEALALIGEDGDDDETL